MRFAIPLLVLLPALAFGQGITTLAPGQTGQKRTNFAKHSNTITSGAALQPGVWIAASVTATTGAVAPASVGGGNWASVTSTSAGGGQAYQGAITTTAGTQIVMSAWTKKASGTGKSGVGFQCGAGNTSACACWRSDGGTCTASAAGGTTCLATMTDLGTTEVRIAALATCGSASGGYALLRPSGASGTETSLFAGAQLEVGTMLKPSRICVTTTASVTCK